MIVDSLNVSTCSRNVKKFESRKIFKEPGFLQIRTLTCPECALENEIEGERTDFTLARGDSRAFCSHTQFCSVSMIDLGYFVRPVLISLRKRNKKIGQRTLSREREKERDRIPGSRFKAHLFFFLFLSIFLSFSLSQSFSSFSTLMCTLIRECPGTL